jgi:hypothetical protein
MTTSTGYWSYFEMRLPCKNEAAGAADAASCDILGYGPDKIASSALSSKVITL